MRSVLAIAWKELQLLWKDKGELMVLFIMPVMFATIIGSAFGGSGTPGIHVYLVNQDSGPFGQQIEQTLDGISALRLEKLTSPYDADARVADSQALAAIVIPEGFSESISTFGRTEVRVISDPTQQQYAGIVAGVVRDIILPVALQGEIQHGISVIVDEAPALKSLSAEQRAGIQAQTLGAVMTQLQRIYTDPLVEVRVEQPAGLVSRDLKTAAAFSMPSYAVMFAFFVMGTVGTTLLREKEDGTLRRLTASPVGRGAIIGGKMLGYMPVVVLQMVVVFSVGRIFFGLSFGNSPIGFLLLSLALALTPTSLGLLLAAISKTPAQAGTTSMIAGILLGVLGGAVVYNPGPGLLDTIRRLLPHHYAIQGFITLSSWGGGLVDVLPYIGVLTGFGLVLFLLAVWRLKLD